MTHLIDLYLTGALITLVALLRFGEGPKPAGLLFAMVAVWPVALALWGYYVVSDKLGKAKKSY